VGEGMMGAIAPYVLPVGKFLLAGKFSSKNTKFWAENPFWGI